MIVKIPTSERPAFEKTCAMIDMAVKFYTHENNDGLVTMEIENLSPEVAFNIARMAEVQIQVSEFIKS